MTAISAEFRAKLREERDAARADSRLKARFLSYRLNLPTQDEARVLLTVDEWQRVTARPVPERGRAAGAEFVIDKVLDWRPTVIVGDRARHAEVLDAVRGRVPVVARVTRWFGAAEDVRALRRSALDGPLAVEESSRGLLAASLVAAKVKSDDQGSTRIVKADPANNTGRDDVAAALTLAAGALSRLPRPRKVRIHVA